MSRRGRAARLLLSALAVSATACTGDDTASDDDDQPVEIVPNDARCLDAPIADEPVLDLLDGAFVALEGEYGSAPELFEVSVDQQRVSMIVALDGVAEESFWCGAAGYAPPEELGEAEGATFRPDAVEFDPDSVFDGVRTELDDPQIIELVAIGNPDGSARFGLSVQSSSGGALLVEISPDGDVLSVDAS